MKGYDFWCDSCEFERQDVHGWDYVTERNHNRYLYTSEQDEHFQEALRDFQSATTASSSASDGQETWESFTAARGGVVYETVCTDCGHLWRRDPQADPLKCLACCSANILEIHQMQNRPCPLCNAGTIQSNQPDLFQ